MKNHPVLLDAELIIQGPVGPSKRTKEGEERASSKNVAESKEERET